MNWKKWFFVVILIIIAGGSGVYLESQKYKVASLDTDCKDVCPPSYTCEEGKCQPLTPIPHK